MENQYAIFKKQDGTFFFNPNCYSANVKNVGDIVDGIECVKVCGLKEAEDFIAAHNPPAGDLFADIMQ